MARHEQPYSKVVRSTWGDAKFSRLSSLKPSGQALWIYLLTGPHCTVIPGLFPKMGIGTLADRLKWSTAAVDHAWRELDREGMANADWDAGVIWLPKAIEHNDPANPNVVLNWRTVVLPQCDLVTRALRSIRIHFSSKENPAWVDAFDEVFRKGFPEVFPKGFPEGFPESRSRSGSRSFPPAPINGGGPVDACGNVEKSTTPIALRVVRQDRREARLIRESAGQCPHDQPCESFSICVEYLAVAIASRRQEIRRASN